MALESSSGLRSSTTPKLRTSSLIVLSAGAALFALISYLYIKKRQQIERKSQQEDIQKEVVEEEMSIKEEEKVTSQSDEKKTSNAQSSGCCNGDLEKISHDLVKIVLNSATKILNDHPSESISDTIKNVEEIELEVGVNELNLHSISLLDSSSSGSEQSSSAISSSDTSLLESPKSYHHHSHMDTDHDNDNEQHQNVPGGGVHPGPASLIKSSSTTSTASSSSSAAISTSNQAVPPSSSNHKSQNKQHKNINNQNYNNMIDSTGTKLKPKSSTSTSTSPNPTTSTHQSSSQQQQQQQQQQPTPTTPTPTPTPLPTQPSSPGSHEDIVVYEFNFPRKFCGKLIGKNGIHVDFIRSKTRTQIAVRDDPEKHEQQIVCVSGRLEDVDQALDIISSRFPIKQYPNVSFKPISKPILYRRLSTNGENNKRVLPFENSCVKKVLVAPNMFVDIKPAANEMTNVHVSAIVNASHVFVQLPGNSTYESLQKLDEHMLEVYGGNGGGSGSVSNSNNKEIPLMVEPVEYGSICVAPTSYGWHRAMVTEYLTADEARQQVSEYSETCGLVTVKFLDYGGYMTIPANQLRQLRSDFMLLPFQAVECYLDGIYVFQGTEEEGKKFLTEIIQGAQLKISLCGYAEDGIPLIKLFLSSDIQNVNINSELVNYSYAFHIDAPLSSNTSTSEETTSLPQSLELDSPTNTEHQQHYDNRQQQPQQSIPKVIKA